jgi:hypothetical protein
MPAVSRIGDVPASRRREAVISGSYGDRVTG